MPLRVNTNIPSVNVRRILNISNRDLKTRIERLSSGQRVNRGADDAAGLSIREGMRAEIGGLTQATTNAVHATNLIQTAEGALNEVNAMLIRMRELSVQSASSTVNDANRDSINAEYVQLISEIDRIATVTSYNHSSLLSGFGNEVTNSGSTSITTSNVTGLRGVHISGASAGTYTFIDTAGDNQITLGNGIVSQTIDIGSALDNDGSGVVATGSAIVANFDRLGIQLTLSGQKGADSVNPANNPATTGYRDGELDSTDLIITSSTGGTFQIGPLDGAVHRFEVGIRDMAASGLALNLGSTGITTLSSAQTAITSVDAAITTVAQQRGDLGAFQNRLAFTIRANENAIENVQASESAISDADIAKEVSAFTRSQILVQAGTALLAQANVLPQNALSLLG